jgi:uncharacterized protein YbjT (DUF2867 family)
MYVIMGATGNTGRPAATALLAAGHRVRVLGRDAARLAPLAAQGAEPLVGDPEDVAFLTRAFTGATAAYVLIAPEYGSADPVARAVRAATVIADAVRASGLTRVVFLSSLGAQHPSGTGPVVGLHEAERILRAVPGVRLTALRAGYFYENSYANLGLIKAQGINGGALDPDVPVSMVAARDIGRAAARELLVERPAGVHLVEVVGPRPLSLREATAILGRAIGKPELPYVRFPDADFAGALAQAGFSPAVAAQFVDMAHALNAGRMSASGPFDAAALPFEAFAEEFAGALQQPA